MFYTPGAGVSGIEFFEPEGATGDAQDVQVSEKSLTPI
jgi:hypothetical protein